MLHSGAAREDSVSIRTSGSTSAHAVPDGYEAAVSGFFLEVTVPSRGARDPYLVRADDRQTLYLFATDLCPLDFEVGDRLVQKAAPVLARIQLTEAYDNEVAADLADAVAAVRAIVAALLDAVISQDGKEGD